MHAGGLHCAISRPWNDGVGYYISRVQMHSLTKLMERLKGTGELAAFYILGRLAWEQRPVVLPPGAL